jgi:tRNA pseudouridine38-40 synthase
VRALWDRRYVTQVWEPLDVAAMAEAARRFEGEHDFAAFAAAGHGRLTTVRTVFECRVFELEEVTGASGHQGFQSKRVRMEVSGSGFLYNMVRIMAGTLVEVGRGRMTADDVSRAIESKDRRRAGATMPAQGLCLEWVKY